MASLRSFFVVMLGGLLCCGRSRYITSRAINHVESLPLSGKRLQADFLQPSSFDNRRRHRPLSSDVATKLAYIEKTEREEDTWFPVKRLAGLFRCSGWGPSCSWSDYDDYKEPTSRSNLPSQRSSNAVHDVVAGERERSARLANSHTATRARSKFQPFFALTSGRTVTRGRIRKTLR